ncbi:hypothetical protein LXA43DRAFT_1152009 [Ganoderma leucocontextum]|nr:hypothetical protein LXA43DRAFT_1152009 [Ganoderma leucocontextum]
MSRSNQDSKTHAMTAILLVFSEPGPNLMDAEFGDWYDNEHVPLRMAIPTFHRTTRWAGVDDKYPQYLATYDLLDRRTYHHFEPDIVSAAGGYDERAPGPYFIMLQASEHIPLLAKVTGWRWSRRYLLRDVGPASGTGAEELRMKERPPTYLAVYEWETPESYETAEFKHATSTP